MKWNYRLLEIKDGDGPGVSLLTIVEVYYDEANIPISHKPAMVDGNNLTEVSRVLDKMQEAIGKDVLSEADFK